MVEPTRIKRGKMFTRTRTAALVVTLLAATSITCDLFNRHPTSRYATADIAWDVAARNDTLVVAQNDSGILFLDISNPKSPQHLQRLILFKKCVCVAFGARTVYAGLNKGLYGFNLEGSGGVFSLSPLGESAGVTALLEDSTRLYMASADGISVFDVTHSWVPDAIGFVPLAGRPTGLARHDSRLFVSLRDWGVRVFNVCPEESLGLVLDTTQLGKHNRAEGVTVSAGGYCIISQGDSGVVVYYSPTPDTVDLCGGGGGGSLSTYATAATDGVQEVSIYVADSSTVTIDKVINKPGTSSFSVEMDFADFTGFTRRICRGGNGYVYTASGEAGVYIIRE
ncbi:MAG: hypothetical protein NTX53_20570 [candidate division WOR-3 bacterium]|nr:hypothetical protein [candidate division WOR-3 bacterium]